MDPLIWAGRHAKWVMAAGLVSAAIPGVSAWMSQILVPLIVAIMFLGALRLRPAEVARIANAPERSLVQVLAQQLILPIGLAVAARVAGVIDQTAVQIVILLMAAPAIISSPNIAAIMGLDSGTSMRLVIWGTLLVPLTAVPVLLLLFETVSVGGVFWAAGRLALIIALAGGLGFVLRRAVDHRIDQAATLRLDGLSAIGLAVFVVALMPALRDMAIHAPLSLLGWVALAVAVNMGGQVAVFGLLRRQPGVSWQNAGSHALATGNRNLALFFAALPVEQTAAFLPFLAAYQIPMYLTPLLLGRFYRPSRG